METARNGVNELARLEAVQARVRALARNHGRFGDAIRAASDGFQGLVERFESEQSAMRDRERGLARGLLTKGRLFDPKAGGGGPLLPVLFEGLCPVALAERLGECRRGMARELEREGAAAALAALRHHAIYQASDTPPKKREKMAAEYRKALGAGTHVSFLWKIEVLCPGTWPEPIDPRSPRPDDLEQFDEADFRTIAFYRLGGLAEVGALRGIIPKPAHTGDWLRDLETDLAWMDRAPIDRDNPNPAQPLLDTRALPPDVAEQMLGHAEAWAKGEATTDDKEYQPAAWFPKGMAARLRMAAAETRKTKRVDTRTIDGVVCYRVADARRWWPSDMPDGSK